MAFQEFVSVFSGIPPKCGDEDGSGAPKYTPVSLPDTVSTKNKTYTPITSDRSTRKKTTKCQPSSRENRGKGKQSMSCEQ